MYLWLACCRLGDMNWNLDSPSLSFLFFFFFFFRFFFFFFFLIIPKSFIQTRPDNRGQSASQTEVKSLILIETKGRVGVQSKFCCDMGSRIARSLNPRERAKLKLWDQGGYIVVYSHPCIWIIHTHTNICIYTKLFYSIQN